MPFTPCNSPKKKRFALVDCNNFYASCERVFMPSLIGKPVVILSNNDGCTIARSNEAKALGIKMGMPYFKAQKFLAQNDVAVFSSNYALYGDLSHRVMDVLARFAPQIEVYSIDEAFLDFQGFDQWDLNAYGREICETTEQWTGIPVSIGFGETKTLAKLANRVAKKNAYLGGVFDFSACNEPDNLLSTIDVSDIWGIGSRWSARLKKEGVLTALDLKQCNALMIKQLFNVVMARTVQELNGVSCIELETVQADRQQVVCSRSFGTRVSGINDLRCAITHFVTKAAVKLRQQHLAANALSVHVSTSPFDKTREHYANSIMRRLILPSNDTRELNQLAQQLLKSIYQSGHEYQRAGVMLLGLSPSQKGQQDLFTQAVKSKRSAALMSTMDSINNKMGNGSVCFAGEGFGGKWRMKQQLLSPRYTTRLSELKKVF